MSSNVTTLKVGIILQGDSGASTGAMILAHKPSDEFTDIILCYASNSPHDPFVVWTYEHATGICRRGEYFSNILHAVFAYDEREW
jgi:hypothetical protein